MKKLLIFGLMIIAICQSLFGQNEKPFSKGYLVTGGTVSFYFEKENDLKSGISPNTDATYRTNRRSFETDLFLGYFLINHFAIGLKTEILLSSYKTTSDLTSSTIWDIKDRNMLIGPFLRYYTQPGIFFECSGGLGILNDVTNNSSFKLKTYNYSAGIGYSLFLNRNISIEPLLKYNFFHKKDLEDVEDVSSMKLSFSIGFQIYLNVNRKVIQNF
jgi:hypothetical protein